MLLIDQHQLSVSPVALLSSPLRAGLQQDPPEGVNASPQAENIMRWNAIIFGPDGKPSWEEEYGVVVGMGRYRGGARPVVLCHRLPAALRGGAHVDAQLPHPTHPLHSKPSSLSGRCWMSSPLPE